MISGIDNPGSLEYLQVAEMQVVKMWVAEIESGGTGKWLKRKAAEEENGEEFIQLQNT